MALVIKRTGLDQYAPGGDGKLKVLLIGGPGVGKTRFSSYWPSPFYLDCEGGLASVADRQVPFATIKNSKDMLDALVYLKQDAMRDVSKRQYRTIIVDTLDAFQRKVKQEWLELNPGAKAFSGYEAWNYLDQKVQMLLTRLLNLDANVIVSVHYSEKTVTEGEGNNTTERTVYQLQLSGAVKDQIYNDFDLVGWMGKYWKTVEGQRVESRGLTFTPTEQKPFLKDRLNVTPKWLEIEFNEEDYTQLFMAYITKFDDLPETQTLGEIADSDEGDREPTGIERTSGVIAPGASGPLPELPPQELPLSACDKPTLAKIIKDEGVSVTAEGAPIRGNTTKAELVAAIEAKRAGKAPQVSEKVAPTADTKINEQTSVDATEVAEVGPDDTVDPKTGEIVRGVTEAQAIETVLTEMPGSEVIDSQPVAEPKPAAPAPAKAPAADSGAKVCAECGKDLTGENPNHVRLSFIKCRKYLCSEHYLATRN